MSDNSTKPKSDWEIAQAATVLPIQQIADKLGIPASSVEPFGHHKAKISLEFVQNALNTRPDGKLILVTAINPTPAGEGKTTTTVGLGDALNRIGKKAAIALREPSLGPCFGMKGGAAGGGYAQVVPMDELNLHFTGDFHAIGIANNLLAALIDNHVYWGNELGFDSRRITWRRCLDMNDRALRQITTSLGGVANGFPREDGFDITVASEIMAILCLATSLDDLTRRLSNIIVGYTRDRTPVRAEQLSAQGAMTAVLKDAIKPNMVQTLENNPVFVHGGPFANIAHGCNSVLATKLGLKMADYLVTEAGFGADLGAEKFFDIKCRKAGLSPSAAVVVASIRALKFHGGVARKDLGPENVDAVTQGLSNLNRHLENLAKFGVPAVVCINRFNADTPAELQAVVDGCAKLGVKAVVCTHWAHGGAGAEELARAVVDVVEQGKANFHVLYPDSMPLLKKIETIAFQIYRAGEVVPSKAAADRLAELEKMGFGHLPVCIAKTQYSNSTDPDLYGAPTGHVLPIREVRLSAGAEFVVVICGEIMTMPGLPRVPSALGITVDEKGLISGSLKMIDGELRAWRKARRAELIAMRVDLPIETYRAFCDAIEASLTERFPGLGDRLLGAYVPFRREFNCTPLLVRLTEAGGRVALPVVLGFGRPLEFRLWKPGDRMAKGVYDIPYPAEGEAVEPETVISPLVGFDAAGYRLGYGAGFYDRTLASFPTKPLTIGVGFELSRMPTIQPQPYDVPMDLIITEAGVFGA